MTNTNNIIIIGGGLAGCEAAWQATKRNCRVKLYDMKPEKFSPAHESPDLAELVCSNSLRSDALHSAVGLLKEEMRRMDSIIMQTAAETAVPAGKALAVDRSRFAAKVTQAITDNPLIEVIREELTSIPDPGSATIILATGPLTSEPMADALANLTGHKRLAFYDAIAPIVYADSLDRNIIYLKSRYDDGPGDYLNCPMDQECYERFITMINEAESVPLHPFEEAKYFEGCLPVEVMASRGIETLRYGPMKPVGLPDPRSGDTPHAVIQLRMENNQGTLYNMVGFQTKLTHSEQKRIFSTIPGMEQVVFARLGSIHRNTFVCAPEVLQPTLQLKARPDILLAGQLSGVEGYVESAAMGLLAGINAARISQDNSPIVPPPETAHGALIAHLTNTDPLHFQPSNVNFGLFPPWQKKVPKKLRGGKRAETALAALAKEAVQW